MNVMAALMASILFLAAQPAQQSKPQEVSARRFDKFEVTLIEDVQVPAREAGVLKDLVDVKELKYVKKDDVLGRVDDSDAQVRKLIAQSELQSAAEQAKSDANVKAAEATVGVAEQEFKGSQKIRERSENAVSEFELGRLRLTHERSVYQAINAKVEYQVAQFAKSKAEAQLQAVENEIKRRMITSPVDGVVVDRFHESGEWAQAGEPIYRVVQMDRLRVKGMLNVIEHPQEDILGSPVRVFVRTAKGEEEFQATIEFASPVVDPTGEYLIHADIVNSLKPNNFWRVYPGMDAEIEFLPRSAPAAANR